MKEFFKKHYILERFREISLNQEELFNEMDVLKYVLNKDVIEILLEIQKELDYKWSFFSGLMHLSFFYYVHGITNIKPKTIGHEFSKYFTKDSEKDPLITIELPPEIELTEFNQIAEKIGYSIIKEANTDFEPIADIYNFIKLTNESNEIQKQQHANAHNQYELGIIKTEVYVIKSNLVHRINKVLNEIPNHETILKTFRTEKSFGKEWSKIARGSILKYFSGLDSKTIDTYFDYEVKDLNNLAIFLSLNWIQNKDYFLKLIMILEGEYDFSLDEDEFLNYDDFFLTEGELDTIDPDMKRILGLLKLFAFKIANDLFLLNYLEFNYSHEFKKAMDIGS